LVAVNSASGSELNTACGSLVVAVRCSSGTLIAADSRTYDPFAGHVRDGMQKVYTSRNFAWFLTGEVVHVAVDRNSKEEWGRVDLYEVPNRAGTASSSTTASGMAQEMAVQAAENLNRLYSRHGLTPAFPNNEFAVLGVVKGASSMSFARLNIQQPGSAVTAGLIPFERIPRVAVVGNDRVYKASTTPVSRSCPRGPRVPERLCVERSFAYARASAIHTNAIGAVNNPAIAATCLDPSLACMTVNLAKGGPSRRSWGSFPDMPRMCRCSATRRCSFEVDSQKCSGIKGSQRRIDPGTDS
jgi:hypothetical protein